MENCPKDEMHKYQIGDKLTYGSGSPFGSRTWEIIELPSTDTYLMKLIAKDVHYPFYEVGQIHIFPRRAIECYPTFLEVSEKTTAPKCSCDILVIMSRGCQCGGT
jgi:hypothetical protein